VAYLHKEEEAGDYAKKNGVPKEELTVDIIGQARDSIASSSEKDFLKEVNVQSAVFENSVEHFGYPLCPAVFDFQIMKNTQSDSLLEQMRRASDSEDERF